MFLFRGTRLKKKLMAYCFSHEDQSFYVREMASLIKEDPGNLSRELARLQKDGLFESTTRGNLRIYSLNRKYPIYKELKEIFYKTELATEAVREAVNSLKGVKTAFIYGTYAKNIDKKLCGEIDIALIGTIQKETAEKRVRALAARLNREINVRCYEEKRFADELKDRNSLVHVITRGNIIMLKGDSPGGTHTVIPQLELDFTEGLLPQVDPAAG